MKSRRLRVRFKIADKSNIVERAIATQDAPYLHSHVELQFTDDSSFSSRAYASNEEKKHNGTSFANVEYNDEDWNTLTVPVSAEQEQIVHRFCIGEDGENYDFEGVTAFKVWLLHQDPEKWFCSEVVATALQQIGWLRELIPSKTSPDLLFSALKALKL